MRSKTDTYKTLRSQTGSYYDVLVMMGNTRYDSHDIFKLEIEKKLFDGSGPSIGNAYAGMCELTLKEDSANWPRMAEFSVFLRLCSYDGITQTEWLPMGTYFTDTRLQDKATGKLTITAYDSMLLYEQYWTDQIPSELLPVQWPITAEDWLYMLIDADLIRSIDYRSWLVIDDSIPFIGLNTTTTIRDVLKSIAAVCGANWTVTYENELRLVPYATESIVTDNAIAGIAVAGIAIVGKEDNTTVLPTGIGYDDLRFNVQSFDTSPALDPITKVSLKATDGTIVESGTDTGYVLNANCEFATTQGVAERCLANVEDYVYKPFTAERATLDPLAEIGDYVVIGGEAFQMMENVWNIGKWPTASIAAPYEEEVNHEYEYVDEIAKTYNKTIELEQTTVRKDSIISSINQTAEAITIQANKVNLTGYITATDVGASGSTIIDGSRIYGGTLVLGGYNNQNGKLQLKDANGTVIIEGNNSGLSVYGGTISGPTINGGTIDGASIIGTTIDFRGSIYGSLLRWYSSASIGGTSVYRIDASYSGNGMLEIYARTGGTGYSAFTVNTDAGGVYFDCGTYQVQISSSGIRFYRNYSQIDSWT